MSDGLTLTLDADAVDAIAQRAVDLLADGGTATVPEIARALRLRDIDVRDVLRHGSPVRAEPGLAGAIPASAPLGTRKRSPPESSRGRGRVARSGTRN